MDSGHHMAEEIPRELAAKISEFLSGSRLRPEEGD